MVTKGIKMLSIKSCPLPEKALLNTYHQSDAYTDCYYTEIPDIVSQAQYVQAFYTTPIFKLERSMIKWLVSKPSSDVQVALLAAGETEVFSAWTVENRTVNQLLLCDYQKFTRSWLMTETVEKGDKPYTRLYFGSAVVPKEKSKQGSPSFGFLFHALSWFHKIYSIVLLRSAKSRLLKLSAN